MSNIGNPPCDIGVIRSRRADAPCEETSRPWVLAATIIGSAMAFIDSTVTNVALPQIQERLGATATEAQWIVASYALFLSALILVGSSLGDHFGRRRIFSLGVIVFTLASVCCGLSTSPEMLIVARAVQGVGGAMLVPGRASAEWLLAQFPDLHMTIEAVISQGVTVAVRILSEGTNLGALDGVVPPTGKRFIARQSHWFRVPGGKLVEHWATRRPYGYVATGRYSTSG